ncbi:Imm51 family immunity protein [Eubacterium sp.]|uniref:Imm51 family immunity protein n=1 Tax=Eubacterium sp. TaxID=142586 RepID=UPI0026DF59B9|nr:Imm51 family immunity protein [Eubacterium sp.]MDO5432914.1 Imm51 family immunity protein [Eubacterium sp.]
MTKEEMNFEESIKPFELRDGSVCLDLVCSDYLHDVFNTRADEYFQGSGYDWNSLAKVFLKEKRPELSEKMTFDSEGDLFCVRSDDENALKAFIIDFKKACDNRTLILDLFSRAVDEFEI